MSVTWERLGRLPALGVLVTLVVVSVLAVLVLDRSMARPIAFAAGLAVIPYCIARPDRRLETFGCFVLPNVAHDIADDVLGVSGLWGLVVLPLVVGLLWDIDHALPDE